MKNWGGFMTKDEILEIIKVLLLIILFVTVGYLIGISKYKMKIDKKINQYNDLLIRYGTLQNNYEDLHSECFMIVGEDA
jgi:hypothetical protein